MSLRASILAALSGFSLLLSGCSKSSIDGTIAGRSISFQDQISAEQVAGSDDLAVLQISSVSGACAAAGAGQKQATAQALTLTLSQGGGQSVSPGAFPVMPAMSGAGPSAVVLYTETSAGCLTVAEVHGLGGSITLDTAGGGAFSGSAEVDLDTDEHVSFSFSTTPCPALASAAAPTSCP